MKLFDKILLGLVITLIIILLYNAPKQNVGSFVGNVDLQNVNGLVISTGGFKGYAFIGALDYLTASGMALDSIGYYAGTSAGSIIAAFLACGLTLEKIKQIIKSSDMLSIFKQRNPQMLADMFTAHTPGYTTFADLNKFLLIPVTKMSKKYPYMHCKYYSNIHTPNAKISDAVMNSSKIPLLMSFNIRLSDGGMTDPYPIRELAKYTPLEKIIGLRLDWSNEYFSSNIALYKLSLATCSWADRLNHNFLTHEEKIRTIPIENHSLKSIITTDEDIEHTFIQGYNSASRFMSGGEYTI